MTVKRTEETVELVEAEPFLLIRRCLPSATSGRCGSGNEKYGEKCDASEL